jgi:hypothetical protein
MRSLTRLDIGLDPRALCHSTSYYSVDTRDKPQTVQRTESRDMLLSLTRLETARMRTSVKLPVTAAIAVVA